MRFAASASGLACGWSVLSGPQGRPRSAEVSLVSTARGREASLRLEESTRTMRRVPVCHLFGLSPGDGRTPRGADGLLLLVARAAIASHACSVIQ